MKAILKYPGAKNRLAPWICRYIPNHKAYLEPFAGSLAVFFNKTKSYIETVNDLDEEIINFFKVVRDRANELRNKLVYTPYARQEYELAFEGCTDEVERARRFCIRCWMGFGNGSIRYLGMARSDIIMVSRPGSKNHPLTQQRCGLSFLM